MSRRTRAQVAAGVNALHREAGGAIRLDTIMPADIPRVIGAALMGERHAGNLALLLVQAQDQVDAAPVARPVLCAACPAPIRGKGHAFMVVTGLVDSPRQGLAFCVCQRCGPTAAAVEAAGVKAAKEFWPDLRALAPMAPGGRA